MNQKISMVLENIQISGSQIDFQKLKESTNEILVYLFYDITSLNFN